MPRGSSAAPFRLKRIYEPADARDGTRVLVDRLWPRGMSKHDAQVELWLKQVAPSAELRQWFGHDPALWPQFQHRYQAELDANGEAIAQLRALAADGPVTLLYAAHDDVHNNARVLFDYLQTRAGHARSAP